MSTKQKNVILPRRRFCVTTVNHLDRYAQIALAKSIGCTVTQNERNDKIFWLEGRVTVEELEANPSILYADVSADQLGISQKD